MLVALFKVSIPCSVSLSTDRMGVLMTWCPVSSRVGNLGKQDESDNAFYDCVSEITNLLLPHSIHYKQFTVSNRQSKGGEFGSTFWKEECQRICRHEKPPQSESCSWPVTLAKRFSRECTHTGKCDERKIKMEFDPKPQYIRKKFVGKTRWVWMT